MYVASGVSLLFRADSDHGGPAGAWALCSGVAAFLAALDVARARLTAPPPRPVFVVRWLPAAAILALPFAAHSALAGTTFAVLAALIVYEGLMCGPPVARAAGEPDSAREAS